MLHDFEDGDHSLAAAGWDEYAQSMYDEEWDLEAELAYHDAYSWEPLYDEYPEEDEF